MRQIPHDLKVEQAVISSILLDPERCMPQCQESGVVADWFYSPKHQLIFDALERLSASDSPIDEVLLRDELLRTGRFEEVGGDRYLFEVCDSATTTAHIQEFLKRLKEYYTLREIVRISNRAIEAVYDASESLSSSEVIESMERDMLDLSAQDSRKLRKPSEVVLESMTKISEIMEGKKIMMGATTGLQDLDRATSGLQPQQLVIVAARPAMGKSALALKMASANAMHKDPSKRRPILFFSLEMSDEQHMRRELLKTAGLTMDKVKDRRVSEEHQRGLTAAARDITAADTLYIADMTDATVAQIRATARRFHMKNKRQTALVVVDYLQLVTSKNRGSRENQVSEISRGFKIMAKELNLPVVVLSQLSREVEKENRHPRLSDLRESGAIEQDADTVIFIAPPLKDRDGNKYDVDQETANNERHVPRELIIAKQREGSTCKIPTTFDRPLTNFENYIPSLV